MVAAPHAMPVQAFDSDVCPVTFANRPGTIAGPQAVHALLEVSPVTALYRAAGHFLQSACVFSVPSPHEPGSQYEFVALST